MSHSEIAVSENILDCSVSFSGNRIVILTASCIELYEWNFQSKPAVAPTKLASWPFEQQAKTGSNTRFRQIVLQRESRIRALAHTADGESKILHLAVNDSKAALEELGVDKAAFDSEQVSLAENILTDTSHEYFWWLNATGLVRSGRGDMSLSSTVHVSCAVVLVEGSGKKDTNEYALRDGDDPTRSVHIFSLSRKGELFANEKLLTRGCTSFVTTDAHLIFTTSQHLLKVVHIEPSEGWFSAIVVACPRLTCS